MCGAGMFFFLAIICIGVISSWPYGPSGPTATAATAAAVPRIVLVAALFGLAITALVFSLAHISGGHLNPAVTFALWLRGSITGG